MNLIPNWRSALKRAAVLRALEVTFVTELILNFVPIVSDHLPRWLTLVLLAIAYACRFIQQRKLSNAAE